MKKRFFAFLLCLCFIIPLAVSCNGDGGDDETGNSSDTSDNQSESTSASADTVGEPNLRLVSFNVRMDLETNGTKLKATSQNRVQAVREQILSYEPDVIGLQEDVQNWVDNINISTDSYTRYMPNEKMLYATQEYLSIYVKNGITVKSNGWKWLTNDGTSLGTALTYAELTDGDGYCDMSKDDLKKLGITNNASLLTKYTDSDTGTSYGSKLAARLMNYVVLEVNGKDVIYVNAHFQHRGYSEAEYTDHPLYMLRYYERLMQYDMLKAQIEELKNTYIDAYVIISGDFNDTSSSEFFKNIEKDFTDSMDVAEKGIKLEHTYSPCFKIDKQGQGYTADNENERIGRIDFCMVSENLKDRVALYQVGAVKWTLAQAEGTAMQNVNVYPSDHLPVIVDFCIG